MRACVLLAFFAAAPAAAQAGPALCGMVERLERASPPSELDSPLSEGTLGSEPVEISFGVSRNQIYVLLVALDGDASGVSVEAGGVLDHDPDPNVVGNRVAFDFSPGRSGRIRVRFSGPRGARYYAGLWRERPRPPGSPGVFGIRPQATLMQPGGAGAWNRARDAAPSMPPDCIRSRTSRAR
jgi:hypothetical protein